MSADEAIFQAVVVTALVEGQDDLDDAKVVDALKSLDPRFAALPDAFEVGVRAHVLLDQLGVEEALEKIVTPIVTQADRDLTFRLCARLMVADGKTEGDEALVLGTLQESFALSHAHVVAVLDEERRKVPAR